MHRPTPIVHQTIAGARAFYALRRRGVPRELAYERTHIVSYVAYWEAQ